MFHNAHLLCKVVPQELIAPALLFVDHEHKHHELAEVLHTLQAGHQEHLQAGREAKKMAAAAAEQANPGSSTSQKPNRCKTNTS